jgi:pilus assembly protein CpaB
MQKITRIVALLLVVFAFALAVVAFGLGRHNAQQAAASATSHAASPTMPNTNQASGTPVVVAADALAAGQIISASSLHVVNEAQAPQGSFDDVNAIAGHMLLVSVTAGTPITTTLLAHGMAMQLMPGERALAVPVDEVAGVGNHVVPGDYVDVFLSLKNPPSANTGPNRDLSQTRLLLSRLRVLAYGDKNLPIPEAPPGKPTASNGESSQPRPDNTEAARTAVLAVPVAEIDQLLLGVQNGKLTLALRYPGDTNRPDNELFPTPPVVLSPLAYLSNEQHPTLASPENDAFAGIDGSGLAGQTAVAPRIAYRRHVELNPGLEIIRGTQRNDGAQTAGSHSP